MRILASIRHPNIISFKYVFFDEKSDISHRDIKSANIFISKSKDYILADLNVSKLSQ